MIAFQLYSSVGNVRRFWEIMTIVINIVAKLYTVVVLNKLFIKVCSGGCRYYHRYRCCMGTLLVIVLFRMVILDLYITFECFCKTRLSSKDWDNNTRALEYTRPGIKYTGPGFYYFQLAKICGHGTRSQRKLKAGYKYPLSISYTSRNHPPKRGHKWVGETTPKP